MLSSMCDKLRETAHEVERIKNNNVDWLWRDAITLDDAVRELRDAADMIDELKTLAQRLYYCGQRDSECDRCGMNGADIHVKMSDVDYCDGINMCMRDLEIEAGDD